MIDLESKATYIASLNESQLRFRIIIPLLSRMGLYDVKEYHGGVAEKGKDIVCRYRDPLGETHHVAIVVKARNIHGAVGRSGSASEVLFQVEQALQEPFSDIYSLEEVAIRECWVMTSGVIKNTAVESIRGKLGKSNLDKVTRFIDRDKIVTLVDRFWPELWVGDRVIEILAHELIAPVSSSRARALFIADHPGNISERVAREACSEIASEMRRLERTIESVATLYRDKILIEKRKINVSKLIEEEVRDVLAIHRKASIEIRLGDLPAIELDARSVKQAIANVLRNAVKYSKLAGTTVTVTGLTNAKQLIIKISDTGVGVPDGWEELIFHVGVKAPNAIDAFPLGPGLGLYLSRRLIELNGGDIRLTSRRDPTEFSIYFPLMGS
jgi:two-component sensor histidine kinase